jgi:hypothetical protein
MQRDSRTVTVDLLQEAGKEFASDLDSERNVLAVSVNYL